VLSIAAALEGLGDEAVAWARDLGTDVARAWRECPQPSWLLQIALEAGVEGSRVGLAAAACARAALAALPPLAPDDAGPVVSALVAYERFAAGDGDPAACNRAARDAANTGTPAGQATSLVAFAAVHPGYGVEVPEALLEAAEGDPALRTTIRRTCLEIVRARITETDVLAAAGDR
jgi:hypothetical protein